MILQHSSSVTHFKPGDCFVGYHSDTIAAVVVKNSDLKDDEQVFYLQFIFLCYFGSKHISIKIKI